MYTKVNPFIQVIEAFKGFADPNALYNLKKQSTGSKIVYSLLIAILVAFMTCGFVVFNINTDKALEDMIRQLPNFSYASGSFYCEETFALPADNSYLIVDSYQNSWDVDILEQQIAGTAQNGYTAFQNALDNSSITEILMISRTNIVSYKKYTGEFTEMTLYEFFNFLGIGTFSKDIILDGYKGFVAKIGIIFALFMIPYELSRLFFVSLCLTLSALIINAVFGSKDNFPTLYWMSVYVQSVLMIIKTIGTELLNMNSFLLTSICFIFYIIIMVHTLKKGDVSTKSTVVYSVNDDLDLYLQQSDFSQSTSVTEPDFNDISHNTTGTDTYHENTSQSAPVHTPIDTLSDSERIKSSTGLSLKIEE